MSIHTRLVTAAVVAGLAGFGYEVVPSESNFMQAGGSMYLVVGILSALLYHLVAGIKHLLMDMGIGEELKSGRLAAKLTLVISVILIVLAGVWVWL